LTACPGCGGAVRQDEDVLDTWFSSWLVPFSSLGWPDQTADLKRFYPGDTLVTAPEILFFWVARMIMAGLEFQGKVPFHTVYLHGTVRDTQHRKMSKSLGNGIDPLEVIERYGADALRYTVISGMAVGTDLILDPADLESSFAAGRNFANKLWNAGRFALGTLDGPTRPLAGPYPDVVRREELTLPDRWIIARCDATVRTATEAFERFRLNDAAAAVYHFLWSDLADWYIEQAKPRLYGQQPGGDVARAVLAQTFDVALRLLHPVMPFVTETLWKRLPGRDEQASISVAPWPRPDDRATDDEALAGFAEVQQIVTSFRQLCADAGVRPGEKAEGALTTGSRRTAERVQPQLETIARLGRVRLDHVSVRADGSTGESGRKTAVLPDGVEVSIELSAADRERECTRLAREEAHLRQLVAAQKQKLGNEQFVSRAPAAVVEGERQKLATWLAQADALAENRRRLGCG
jgi:valyl-tRNA synthetase